MLTEVRLYGHLGKRFGRVHRFALRTPGQAMSALAANLPGFRRYMHENSEPGYYVIAGKNQGISEEELGLPRELPVLKIVPGVQGRKAAGGFQMILGAVLMAIGLIVAGGTLGAGAPVGTFIFKFGLAMFLGGLSAYLSQPPNMKDNDMDAKKSSSYAFDGPENTVAQGGPVPVVYGMLGVGSTLAAAAIYVEEMAIGGGGVPDDDIPGGDTFHIYRPRLETVHVVDRDDPYHLVSDNIAGTAGTEPYTFTVTDDTGTFALGANGHSLKAVAADGKVELGSYSITISAEDSAGHTTTKMISYEIKTPDVSAPSASMYFPGA